MEEKRKQKIEALYKKYSKQEEESIIEETFYKHKNHVFIIVSDSGKPFFSRYGDVMSMCTTLAAFHSAAEAISDEGNLPSMINNATNNNSNSMNTDMKEKEINIEIESDEKRILFENRWPFMFVSFNGNNDTYDQIKQLHKFIQHTIYVHVPLAIFKECLAERQAADIRQCITDNVIDIKIAMHFWSTWIGAQTEKVEWVTYPLQDKVHEIITTKVNKTNQMINNDIVMCVVHKGKKVMHCVSNRALKISPNDINGMICYSLLYDGEGDVGLPEFSESGKLKVFSQTIGIFKIILMYQNQTSLNAVKECVESITNEFNLLYTKTITYFNAPTIPDLYTQHLLFYYVLFGDDYVVSGPMRELFTERKQRKRIKTLCSKLYWENENMKKMNEPKVTNGIKCSSFQTDMETIATKQTNKGLLICVFNFIVDIPTSIDYINVIDRWLNNYDVEFKYKYFN